MLSTQLKLLKEKRKLTTQQLSDLSGVPVGTINRILSGQTDNPSFQTVCDLVLAMDGSLDEIVGIKDLPEEGAEKKARASEEILAIYESMIAYKNQWIHRFFVCCCVLTLVLIFLVCFDLLNPSVGFFRG